VTESQRVQRICGLCVNNEKCYNLLISSSYYLRVDFVLVSWGDFAKID